MKVSKPGKRRQQRRPSGRKRKARQVAQARRLPGKQVRGNHLPERTLHPQPEGLQRLSLHSHTLPPPLALLLLWVLDGVTACCAWLRAPLLRQWRHGLPALTLVALLSAAFAVASCGDSAAGEESDAGGDTAQLDDARDDRLDRDEEDDGIVWINELTSADTILLTDLTGSALGEANGLGKRRTEVALYPYGLARYDDSRETNVFVDSPRDRSVGLDHMGARFYSPELGIWTSADPAILTEPEQYVTAEFAAANPYAYANLRPVVAADRDGQFWHIAAGVAVGAVLGGGAEALSQYLEHGKIESWGRVGAATGGGAAGGLIAVTNPAAALSTVMGGGAASSALTGVTERLIASGGKSAGTLTEVAVDAATGAGSAGIVKGGASLLRKVVPKKVAPPASKGPVAKAGVPGIQTSSDDFAHWVRTSDPRAFARLEPMASGLNVTDIFRGGLAPGSGTSILAEGLRTGGLQSGQQLTFSNITNTATREAFAMGVPAADSLLGRVGQKALGQVGLKGSNFEFHLTGDKLGLTIGVK